MIIHICDMWYSMIFINIHDVSLLHEWSVKLLGEIENMAFLGAFFGNSARRKSPKSIDSVGKFESHLGLRWLVNWLVRFT